MSRAPRAAESVNGSSSSFIAEEPFATERAVHAARQLQTVEVGVTLWPDCRFSVAQVFTLRSFM